MLTMTHPGSGTSQTSTGSSSAPSNPPAQATPYRYTPQLAAQIEQRWQRIWKKNGTFNAPNPTGALSEPGLQLPAERMFIQDMFPYPSGVGLHVGHPLGYIATDVFARFHRMKGANVLHTLGYDAFGLPAEQYAVQTGTHPRTTTMANIENMQRQLSRLGLGHDQRRSVATTDTDFYRWTQWIFLQIYNSWFDPAADEGRGKARPITELEEKLAQERPEWASLSRAEKQQIIDEHRLVYRSHSVVNWCPGLGTVLANEEVTAEGRSERGNFPVFRKKLQQWMMRITAYADRLLDDLDYLDWPDKVKSMQRHWIGRSRGAEVIFSSDATPHCIKVFTTRPDTLFGASYMVLAPEHELVDQLASAASEDAYENVDPRWTWGAATPTEAVAKYRAFIAAKSDVERQESKEKTGVYLGVTATNPVNGQSIPVFIADYVLMGYGTGAIMAVPAHDERDFEFAQAFGLPIHYVLAPRTQDSSTQDSNKGGADAAGEHTAPQQGDAQDSTPREAYTGAGVAVNSANQDGLDINGLGLEEAKAAIIDWLEARGVGEGKIQYKLRDWLFARQRYWGEPFPIVYDKEGIAHALPESMLPIELPEVEDYRPVSFDPDDADSQPQPPLAKATDWVTVELDLGDGLQTYYRDTNVMPQWAGSSWYQLRYIDPLNDKALVDIENERYWVGPKNGRPSGGVDLYVGGVEHAVLHLLYSRFWHKVLYDLGHVSSFEPYYRLFNQGYIQAYAYTDARGVYVPAAEVVEREGKFYWIPAASTAESQHADQVKQPEAHSGSGTAGQPQSQAQQDAAVDAATDAATDTAGTAGQEAAEPQTQAEPVEVFQEYGKMGKSLKNAVSPDEICDNYGADTLRVYEMSMGPLDTSRPWSTKDVVGAQRFLQRTWRLVVNETSGHTAVTSAQLTDEDKRILHRTIAGVHEDYAALRDNTAVAKLIEYVNYLTKNYGGSGAGGIAAVPRDAVEPLVLMLAPIAPHIAEEMWLILGKEHGVAYQSFPTWEKRWLKDDTIELPVQVMGKLRGRITVAVDASQEDIEAAALKEPHVAQYIEGKEIAKIIVVPGKMINIVAK